MNAKHSTNQKVSKDGPTLYIIETPSNVYWSPCKMATQYRHVDFLWRDKARYKEMSEFRFKNYIRSTKKVVQEIQ